MTDQQITSAMGVDSEGENPGAYADAVWVGSVDLEFLTPGQDLRLAGGGGFRRARLLVWADDAVRGFVELDVTESIVPWEAFEAGVDALPSSTLGPRSARVATPTSVIVCTRDRPDDLARCLQALLRLDYD